MSLILEALRKSEAERRRGQVPDLHSEPSPAALRGRGGPPASLWLALAFATAVVLAMALWLARGVLSGPPPAIDVPVAATGPAAAMSVDSSGDAGLSNEPIGTVGPSTMPDARAGSGPVLASMPLPGREHGVAIPATPSAAATPSTPPARAPETTRAAVAAAPAISPAPPAIASPAPAVTPTASPATVPAAVVSTSEAATLTAATSGSAPLRLSDLAVAQRQQLPPLKMSMHMWAPTQRFAIIDGARVSEGDRVGDAVVEEITANGVVLAWQGQRLQIPTR